MTGPMVTWVPGYSVLNRLGHHMGAVVPDQLQRFRVVAGQDLDRAVAGDRIGKIGKLSVERYGDGLFGERFGDRRGQLGAGDAGLKIAHGAVGESQMYHLGLSLPHTEAGKTVGIAPELTPGARIFNVAVAEAGDLSFIYGRSCDFQKSGQKFRLNLH